MIHSNRNLPVGKLPVDILVDLLARAPVNDPRVLLGPGIGLDNAVVNLGDRCLVFKSDPITFATDEIGWYAVQVNANDIATSGARPRWMLVTLLLPEASSGTRMVSAIFDQVYKACEEIEVDVIGGHTEITFGLERPILVGTLIGEVKRESLITPQGIQAGDRLLLTKGVPVEATAIICREFPNKLKGYLQPSELKAAQDFLYQPGISVLREAQLAADTGLVTGMHDPTEGGLYGALWELAQASDKALAIELSRVSVPEISRRVCDAVGIDPLGAIASGSLLLAVKSSGAAEVCSLLEAHGITCTEIGEVFAQPAGVWSRSQVGELALPRPERDEIARLFGE